MISELETGGVGGKGAPGNRLVMTDYRYGRARGGVNDAVHENEQIITYNKGLKIQWLEDYIQYVQIAQRH